MATHNSRYHTIFFDVGGTLMRAHPSIGEIYAEVAARHGIEAKASEIEEASQRSFVRMQEDEVTRGAQHTTSLDLARDWWREHVRQSFGPKADSPRFEDFFLDVFDEFARPDQYRIFDDVEAALGGLERAGYRIGIISNWDVRLRPVLEGLDLARRFNPILISGEVGLWKPNRAIFDLARERSGAPEGARLLHVGDDRRDDVEGAIAAGFEARHLDRRAGETLLSVLEDLFD